jgi:hypothetical protein
MSEPWVAVDATDIVSRWRPLTDLEQAIVPKMIEDAQDLLEESIEDLGYPEVDPLDSRQVRRYKRTVATMVKRVLMNPDGYLSETVDGEYTYRRDSAVSTGALYVADDEIDRFRPKPKRRHRSAFSITPS